MKYDTATNSFRPAKPSKAGGFHAPRAKPEGEPLRKERKQKPGGFSRAAFAGKPGQPPQLPRASNVPKGQKRPFNASSLLPPE